MLKLYYAPLAGSFGFAQDDVMIFSGSDATYSLRENRLDRTGGKAVSFFSVDKKPKRLNSGNDFVLEKVFGFVGLNGEKLSVHGDANALFALAEAERAGEFDFILEVVFLDEVSEFVDDLTRAFDVAGTADTYGDF